MCNSTTLPLTPLTPLKPEEFYGTPKCEAFADSTTFLLIDSVTGTEITLKGLEPKQLSALVLAWRQGCFCGETGEELAFLINTYGNLAGDCDYDLF